MKRERRLQVPDLVDMLFVMPETGSDGRGERRSMLRVFAQAAVCRPGKMQDGFVALAAKRLLCVRAARRRGAASYRRIRPSGGEPCLSPQDTLYPNAWPCVTATAMTTATATTDTARRKRKKQKTKKKKKREEKEKRRKRKEKKKKKKKEVDS